MMNYKFSNASRERLKTCHPDLIILMTYALATSRIDFTIVCGERDKAAQEAAFIQGNSRARFGQSPHNYSPSLAVDICPWADGALQWNNHQLFDSLAEHIKTTAKRLGIEVTWGGDFKSIVDKPHFELKNWKKIKNQPYIDE
jgi:hypothetical protein